MASFNRVIMIGNLTRDPDHKQLASGQAVCRLGLASNRQFKNKQTGNMIQEVCFVDIDVWGAQAESCKQYLQKGRAVLVEGRLKFDSWEDAQGQTRSKHSIVADRVVFLSNAATEFAGAERADVDKGVAPKNSTVDAQLEKELLDQIEQIKNRADDKKKSAKQTKKDSTSNDQLNETGTQSGEIDFKDDPPFQDDLPF